MKKFKTILLCGALLVGGAACEKNADATGEGEPSAEAPAEEEATEAAEAEEKEAPAEEEEGAEEMEKVELAAAGAKFDPAIKPEQLPDGAWYCDMGTVHWAAAEKPEDGKCPECGMALKEYSAGAHAEQKAKAIEAKDDHGHAHEDGHGHDEDGHGHDEDGHGHGEDGHEH